MTVNILLLNYFPCNFYNMDISPHNIQCIIQLIQLEVDYNFINPGYTIAFQDEQVLLEQSDN